VRILRSKSEAAQRPVFGDAERVFTLLLAFATPSLYQLLSAARILQSN
jgi:hypothetical protein